MRIAIASGKGGTGKTTVAVNLAEHLRRAGTSTAFVDCDVEEPNAHFFLHPELDEEATEHVPVPDIHEDICLGEDCRRCIELCRFKALIWMGGSVMSFPELCHGCGLCALACPAEAIGETTREIGTSALGNANGMGYARGLLRIGEAMAPPLIKAVKQRAEETFHSAEVTLLDCPPGTSCPVVASLQDVDYAVLVTEPTPFGLHDLKLAVGLLRELDVPFGVVVNRAGMGDASVEAWLAEEAIPLLAAIPYSRQAAERYSNGGLLIDDATYARAFADLADVVLETAREAHK